MNVSKIRETINTEKVDLSEYPGVDGEFLGRVRKVANEIKKMAPQCYERIQNRRKFTRDVLNINLA